MRKLDKLYELWGETQTDASEAEQILNHILSQIPETQRREISEDLEKRFFFYQKYFGITESC